MPVIALLNQAGAKVADLTLAEEVFGIEPNRQVVYDVVNAQRAAMRQGTHDTKGRSEVRGGGRKPWRQKGTGRARQGSIRAPQWRGGGTVFGPTPRSYAFKLNKKVKQLGMKSTLSFKVQNDKLIAVDALVFDQAKTKSFIEFLSNVKAEGKTIVICTREELTENAISSARNVPNVFLTSCDNASVYEILCFDKVVATKGAIIYFEEVLK